MIDELALRSRASVYPFSLWVGIFEATSTQIAFVNYYLKFCASICRTSAGFTSLNVLLVFVLNIDIVPFSLQFPPCFSSLDLLLFGLLKSINSGYFILTFSVVKIANIESLILMQQPNDICQKTGQKIQATHCVIKSSSRLFF
jgi:hypothetical protein